MLLAIYEARGCGMRSFASCSRDAKRKKEAHNREVKHNQDIRDSLTEEEDGQIMDDLLLHIKVSTAGLWIDTESFDLFIPRAAI